MSRAYCRTVLCTLTIPAAKGVLLAAPFLAQLRIPIGNHESIVAWQVAVPSTSAIAVYLTGRDMAGAPQTAISGLIDQIKLQPGDSAGSPAGANSADGPAIFRHVGTVVSADAVLDATIQLALTVMERPIQPVNG